jgi:threonylcarbamoyladenosine tRNA methylthiotransferase MtaB
MPQLARDVVKARAARLRKAAAKRRSDWLDHQVGTNQPVLIENNGKGHADNFAPVSIPASPRGQIGLAKILGRDGDTLVGVLA